MKTKITTTASLIAAATALLATATAAAQERPERDGPFADGALTRAEAVDGALKAFDMADENSDGYLSEGEAEDARDAAKARMEERRAEWKERGGRRGGRKGGQNGGQGFEPGKRFDAADTDDDGFVSRREAEEAALARFDRADTDGDGEITRDEMRERMRGQRGRR